MPQDLARDLAPDLGPPPTSVAFAVPGWGVGALAWSARGLVRVRVPDPALAAPAAPVAIPAEAADWVARLTRYFAGEAVDLAAIPLDDRALSVAEAAIYAALRAVPRGATVTYGALAARAGMPGAARAVGVAMARNPWPIVVPCHRVLASDGRLGGFSAPGGVRTKRRLLRLEGVDPDGGRPPLPGLFDDDA